MDRDELDLARAAPAVLLALRPSGELVFASDAFIRYVGPAGGLGPAAALESFIHPSDRFRLRAALSGKPATAGEDYSFRLRGADGFYRRFRFTFERRQDDAAAGDVVIAAAFDVEELWRAIVRERVYSRLGEELPRALSLEDRLRIITRLVVPEFADWAVVHMENDAGEVVLAATHHREPDLHGDLEAAIGRSFVAAGSLTHRVMRSGIPCVEQSYGAGPASATIAPEFRDVFARIDVRSVIVVPIVLDGRPIGVFQGTRAPGERQLSADDVPLFEELAGRIGPAMRRAREQQRNRRVADRFQEAALPPGLPSIRGMRFDAVYVAAHADATVGGDWYDAFPLPDGRIVCSVGDVGGNGLDAAVMMASVRQSVRTAAIIDPEPGAMLGAVDRMVRSMDTETLVTAIVGVFDPIFGSFVYASAGHPPALLRRSDGTVQVLGASGLPLGLRGADPEGARSVRVEAPAALLFYTDGLTEFDRDALAGEATVVEAFGRTERGDPAHAVFDAIAHGRPSRDDVAILAVAFDGDPPRDAAGRSSVVRWSYPDASAESVRSARRALAEAMTERGFERSVVEAAVAVCGELAANVVEHAPGPFDVAVDARGNRPIVHVRDGGPGIANREPQAFDPNADSGRGLFIVRRLAETTLTRRTGGGTHVRAIVRLGTGLFGR